MTTKSTIQVRYAETDKMGIVYHTNYGIWYEVGRTDYFKNIGLEYSKMEEIGILVPVLELYSKYIKPAYYDEKLTIETSLKKLTPVKIEFEYNIKNEKNEKINTGSSVHTWTTPSFELINLKKSYTEMYEKIKSLTE